MLDDPEQPAATGSGTNYLTALRSTQPPRLHDVVGATGDRLRASDEIEPALEDPPAVRSHLLCPLAELLDQRRR
jgi:hypothetical protein